MSIIKRLESTVEEQDIQLTKHKEELEAAKKVNNEMKVNYVREVLQERQQWVKEVEMIKAAYCSRQEQLVSSMNKEIELMKITFVAEKKSLRARAED